MSHLFDEPVSVWCGKMGLTREIISVEEASRLMVECWPARADTVDTARILLAAQNGGCITAATRAFREAAASAGILVG